MCSTTRSSCRQRVCRQDGRNFHSKLFLFQQHRNVHCLSEKDGGYCCSPTYSIWRDKHGCAIKNINGPWARRASHRHSENTRLKDTESKNTIISSFHARTPENVWKIGSRHFPVHRPHAVRGAQTGRVHRSEIIFRTFGARGGAANPARRESPGEFPRCILTRASSDNSPGKRPDFSTRLKEAIKSKLH